jgi:phenylalanyl-tRNA synthetase beta chain
MPTLDVSKKDLEKLVGKKFNQSELEEVLEYVKGEIDGIEGDNLKVDCKETNRPDLWSTEGLAREIKARIGKEKGIKKYKVKKSNVEVIIDKNLKNIRPLIACAIVKNVNISENLLIQLIQLQEKVGDTFGRKRKETGIGLYDLDIMSPPIYYKGFKDNEIEFIPLEWKVKMRPSEILTQHEKGKQYAHLLEGTKTYPIVIDSKNVVASMPPIINSQITGKVTEKTKNLFIEVTGNNWEIIETALEVMCMAIADRGGQIYSVKTKFPKDKFYPKDKYSPEFKTEKISFEKDLVKRQTGLDLNDKEIKSFLEKARYNVKISKNKIEVEYPSYRRDIFHAVDVIEDLLISYGYNKIEPEKIIMDVKGSQKKEVLEIDFVREAAVGLGLQEIMTYNLTSKELQANNMNLEEEVDDFVEIANPVSKNYEILRKRLTPNVLAFISKNKGVDFPQKIFEVGTALKLNKNEENGVTQTTNICVATTHTDVDFTEIKSLLMSMCDYLGKKVELKREQLPFLTENSAVLKVDGKEGFIGEITKEVSSNFGLKKPVFVFEFEI